MKDLSYHLLAKDLGARYLYLTTAPFLFMGNISVIAESKQELAKMLQVTDKFLNKWHLKVNQSKSGVIVFNCQYNVKRKEENQIQEKNPTKPPRKRNTNKWNNSVMCFCINEALSQIKMETLYYSFVSPALLYGCETWMLSSPEIKHLSRIQMNLYGKHLNFSHSSQFHLYIAKLRKYQLSLDFMRDNYDSF